MLRDSGTCLLLCDKATAGQVEAHGSSLTELRDIVRIGAAGTGGTEDRWRLSLEAESTARWESTIDPHAPAAVPTQVAPPRPIPREPCTHQHNLLAPGAHLVATRKYDERLRKEIASR